MRNKGLNNILYAYNTDKVYSLEDFLSGYPGDEYIDMLSIDWYGQGEEFNKLIDIALDFGSKEAIERGKLFALTECGNIGLDLVDIIKKYKVSHFLTWRHAPLRGDWVSNPMMIERREKWNEQLREMYNDPHTLFLNDIKDIK